MSAWIEMNLYLGYSVLRILEVLSFLEELMIWKHYRVCIHIMHTLASGIIFSYHYSVLVSRSYFIHNSSEWQLGLEVVQGFLLGHYLTEVYCSGVLLLAATLTYQYKKTAHEQTLFRPCPYRNVQQTGLVQAH
jgi:hypothetical protein